MVPYVHLIFCFTLCFFSLLHFDNGQEVGVCTRQVMVKKTKYVIDRKTSTWKPQEYQEPREVSECCEGFNNTAISPSLQCVPVCAPECVNGLCEAPNTCVCPPGHTITNNSSNTCYDICDSCVNSECLEDDTAECVCNEGYEKDHSYVHVCNPVCSPSCVNATCSAPGECECFQGFIKDPGNDHLCVPECQEECVFGKCTAPYQCTCFDGYINDSNSPSVCVPICTKTCTNGFCVAPYSCECNNGFQPHPTDKYQCVPIPPQNSTLTFCELRVPKAVKFDKHGQCFEVRDKVSIQGDPQCKPLSVLSEPSCALYHSCFNSQCLLNFLCAVKEVNGIKEVHCDMETEDFETEENEPVTINDGRWTDMVLVINALQNVNTNSVSINNTFVKEWTISPLNTGPVCGERHFGLQICNSDCFNSKSKKSSSSKLTWISSLYFLAFLILVVIGGGWFLWARHRRLNDPLNYRETMIRGYSNQGFESQNQRSEFLVMGDSEDGNL